jgi:hypothetical protein
MSEPSIYYTMDPVTDNYYNVAKLFPKTYGLEVSDHIVNIIASVMMTRDNVLHGGSFVNYVIQNDLRGAILHADDEVLKNIKIIVLAKENAFVE